MPPSSGPQDPESQRLIVALDVRTPDQAKRLVASIGDACSYYKVGLELYLAKGGSSFPEWLRDQGKAVFLDLKLHDIPRTVEAAVSQLSHRGISLLTVHPGRAMIEAAERAKGRMRLLGVTVLTSMDGSDLQEIGCDGDVTEVAIKRAQVALRAGCDGVVASGFEAAALRKAIPGSYEIVVPGIRRQATNDDQKRTVSPADAFQAGASRIVVGRPIWNAGDPRAAAIAFQESIERS